MFVLNINEQLYFPKYNQGFMIFSHLHLHTTYSLLDGASDISLLYKKAVKDNMRALAITDHGNMFGAFKFVAEAGKYNTPEEPNKIKPIVGCEFYVVENRHKLAFTRDDKDIRYHQLFLAKDANGYKNLIKLCSLGFIEGLYGKYPRIDKELILKYHEGLIATTCCIGASVPKIILKKGEEEGEKEFKWWLDVFGDDYYIELQRHGIPEQNTVNEVLLRFAKKYNVKIIASNDAHYVEQEDSNAHDILLCINTGKTQSTPTFKELGDEDTTTKDKRFAFFNDQFYFKTTAEMTQVFSDLPQAIDNTNDVVDKIEKLDLTKEVLLPNYKIPLEFLSQEDFLVHQTKAGAAKRYIEMTGEIEERINFELNVISTMGFAGYFLIVADFINHGKDIGVFVGPGRGSAAGSVVAYCLGITNIDPIKYGLLFERFLNPNRKSLPDIDTDFDDEGRQKVIEYVVEKYGKNQVAQIGTYGTMASRSSIKDVARVLDLPLTESNLLAKMVPSNPGIELNEVLLKDLEGDAGLKKKYNIQGNELEDVKKLREIFHGNDLKSKVLKEAIKLEGGIKNTSVHAAGIIISPTELSDLIPVYTSKETDLLITQFEGDIIENAGVLKMDFLGLKTLSIIRDAMKLIKQNHNIDIDIDNLPLDDLKTYELFQKGNTIGIFQFEAPHILPILKELKPTCIEDLIALNALNRPGPSMYIPDYIARKHGKQKITYDLPELEKYLKETFGITVYQEQVMLLSQELADFTKGDADYLRKAMGKKDKQTLDKMKSKFMEGATAKNHAIATLEKIWADWEKFAQYAFNKSHSTCYAIVAYQTAYLKANYTAEFMASILTHNLGTLEKITFYMDECKRMNLSVLGPDVNESDYQFAVNKKGDIRFGMGAIKGVGESAVSAVVNERNTNGQFKNVFDFVKRINLRAFNKRTFEGLAFAGGLDSFGIQRSTFFHTETSDAPSFMEKLLRFGSSFQEGANSSQVSLFGSDSMVEMPEPKVPVCEEWNKLDRLKKEKEVVGFFISGHPLDAYKLELETFCTHSINELKEVEQFKNKELVVGCIVTGVHHGITKTGNPWGKIVIEDYRESSEIAFFGEDYLKFKPFMIAGLYLYVKGKIQLRYHNSENLEFKVSNIQLLSEIRDKLAKTLTINIQLENLNEQTVVRLKEILNANTSLLPAKCSLQFKVIDKEENISVVMPSKKLKINPTNELLEMFQTNGLEYKLN